jgi:hypothetical protein
MSHCDDVELRVLRERQEALSRAVDLAGGQPTTFASARILVSVFDDGSIPIVPNVYYLTNPVQITGTENENDAGTFDIDTDTVVPVIVLANAPIAGDLLVATSVGGRWVAEEGPVALALSMNFVIGCCNSAIYAGPTLTVEIWDSTDSTMLTSGTTTTGLITLTWTGSSGFYHVHISGQSSGWAAYNVSQLLSFGSTPHIGLTLASGYRCCACCEPVTIGSTLTCSFLEGSTPTSITLTSTTGSCVFTGSTSLPTNYAFTFDALHNTMSITQTGIGCLGVSGGALTCSPFNAVFTGTNPICNIGLPGINLNGPITITP